MYNWDDDFFSLDDGDASPAQIFCPQGSLAQIESKEENEFIMKFLSKSEGERYFLHTNLVDNVKEVMVFYLVYFLWVFFFFFFAFYIFFVL